MELKWYELNHSYQPSDFSFHSTNDVQNDGALLDQNEALEAIKRGLKLTHKGYNLFVCTAYNNRIEQAIIKEIEEVAKEKPRPLAVGYLYNFNDPSSPIAIEMPSEIAQEFKQDLSELRAFILTDIPILLDQKEIKAKQKDILMKLEQLTEMSIAGLTQQAKSYQIGIEKSAEGIYFIPLNEKNEFLTQEEFACLNPKEQEDIMKDVKWMQNEANDVMKMLEDKEKEYEQLYNEVGQEMILRELGKVMKQLNYKYQDYPILESYFNGIAEEILENLELLASLLGHQNEVQENAQLVLLMKQVEQMIKKYDVNFLTMPVEDYAPVIHQEKENQMPLIAHTLLNIEENTVCTDFMQIRPGLLNKANGGYLILHVDEFLEKKNYWRQLKTILKTNHMMIEGNEQVGIAITQHMTPEPLPIQVKVIVIGTREAYELLKNYDVDFPKLFKVSAFFDETIKVDKKQIEKIAGIIHHLSNEEDIKPVSTEALLRIIKHGQRQLGHPHKIVNDFDWIMDILRETEAKDQIEESDVEDVLKRRESYQRKIKEELDESLVDGTYLIDTKGAKVGQINGLAVYVLDNFSVGRPVRITATTYKGRQGIMDIEHASKLGGSIHTKGVHIITGFLGNQFAQDQPLSLNCNLCFEQSYSGIDGDSASSAELYAILSSLSELPVRQDIAVTGSVNQFGEIQPVGGINEKIEGFFNLCNKRGLTGNEGVMIPERNMKDLLLEPIVIEAVKDQKFHLYAINNVWDGVGILLGETKQKIKEKIIKKLEHFNH